MTVVSSECSVSFQGNSHKLNGFMPSLRRVAPDFCLANSGLSDVSLSSFPGKMKILNIFPSIDTPVCAVVAKNFIHEVKDKEHVVLLNISADLPFAHTRFCLEQMIGNAVMLSFFRSNRFLNDYGLGFADGPFRGLSARAVIVLDEQNRVLYHELVRELTHEPDYKAALSALEK